MVLRINYWNCGSGILKKFDLIKEMIVDNNLDMFFVSECEIRFDLDLSCLSIMGYKVVLANTIESRKKARILCIMKTGCKVVNINCDKSDVIAVEWGGGGLWGGGGKGIQML